MKIGFALTAIAALAACSGTATRSPAGAPATGGVDYLQPSEGPYTIQSEPMLVLNDPVRNKELQVRITWPDAPGRFPVIVWSHGARGSKDIYRQLVDYWVSHGYVCIQPNHSDSRDFGNAEDPVGRFSDWGSRPADMVLILDSLDLIGERVPALRARMDQSAIGAGGHSFGAHTAQLLAGARPRDRTTGSYVSFEDPRPEAFLLMSPQGTGERESGLDTGSWSGMDRPVMVATGSNDPGRTGKDWRWRLEPFRFAPPRDKYLLYIDGVYHGFGGAVGSGFATAGPENPVHVRYIQGLSLAFWDAYLKNSQAALAFLRSGESNRITDGEAQILTRDGDEDRLDDLGTSGPAEARGILPTAQIFARFDVNGDGRLAGDEMPPRLAAAFAVIDRDGSGYVSEEELNEFLARRRD